MNPNLWILLFPAALVDSLRQTEVIIKEMTSANFLLMKLVNSITVETLRYSSHITIG